jgi:parallel beta-helix repeat protein
MKRNLVGKIFGIALVFVMIASMLGYLPSTINTIDASPANEDQPPLIGPGELGYNNVRNLGRTSDGALHCVYSRSDGSYTQIYYSCSSDGGETWTEEQITDAPHNHGLPSIAIDSNDDIHVVWSHCQEPSYWGKTCTIQYRVKKATTWQPIEDVITSYGSTPSIAIDSEDNIHLVLSGFWGGAYNCNDVKYMKRTSSGWSSPEKVSTQCWACNPAIAVDNDDNIHVVYRNSPLPSPSGGIRYREKTASGWGSEVVIEPNDSDATTPSIAIDSNNYVHIVWQWKNPNKDEWAIKYVKFTDSWQPIEILEGPTSYPQGYPSISVDGNDNLHVVWEGKHSGSPNYYQIRYRKYTASWSPVENLTSASVNQTNPNLIWAWWPTEDNLRTNRPENGYAFVWNDGSNIRFYKSSDLEWEAGPGPRTWYVDDDRADYPGANFTKIQDAVDAASAGDTIIVYPGTYTENVDVNKDHLTIQSQSGADSTIVRAANPQGQVFYVTANYTNITGFTVQNATGDDMAGIYLDTANHCNISSNNAMNNCYGIALAHSSNETITNNNVSSNSYGIWLWDSSSNILTNNASNNYCGIQLYSSSNNTLTNNTASSNDYGILLSSSSNNMLTNNTANLNNEAGVFLDLSSDNIIRNNQFESDGILVWGNELSHYNTQVIEGNTVNGKPIYYYKNKNDVKVPEDAGEVIAANCTDMTIENVDASFVSVGIEAAYVDDSKISSNNVSNTTYGIWLLHSGNNTILNNNVLANNNTIILNDHIDYILNSGKGISLDYSSHNTLIGNTMFGSGIVVIGGSLEDFDTHEIDTSNQVNGKPVYYWANVKGGKIPGDAGEVILANCENVIVESQELNNGSIGTEIAYSSNVTFKNNDCSLNNMAVYIYGSSNNVISSNECSNNRLTGIGLEESSNNNISDNNCLNNLCGLWLYCSDNNTVSNNNCNFHDRASVEDDYISFGGIAIEESDYNIISNNNCLNNTFGIWFEGSDNNTIVYNNILNNGYGITGGNDKVYLNNFINNANNTYSTKGYTNTWNSPEEITYAYNGNTYTSYLGNYWSDYTGSDAGGDGIGDAPYSIDSDADNYPLTVPFENYEIGPPVTDTTPPTTPLVTVEGGPFAGTTQLHASWNSSDPESGIVEYQYAIGTSAGGTDVVGWTSMGTASEVTESVIGLSVGTTYYFAVKAKNGQGLWSEVGTSNGITVTAVVLDLPSDWMDKQLFCPVYYRPSNTPGTIVLGVHNKRDMWYLVKVYTRQGNQVWEEYNQTGWIIPYLNPFGEKTFTYTPKPGEEIKIEVSNDLNDDRLRALWCIDFAARSLLGVSISPEVTDPEAFFVELLTFYNNYLQVGGYLGSGKYDEAVFQLGRTLLEPMAMQAFYHLLTQVGIPISLSSLAAKIAGVSFYFAVNVPMWWDFIHNMNKDPWIEQTIFTAKAKTLLVPPDIRVTKSLRLVEEGPYDSGETITAQFSVANRGTAPVKLNFLTAGGRGPGGYTDVHDFTYDTAITLDPGESCDYEGKLFLSEMGHYYFFITYQTSDGQWYTSVPTEGLDTNTLDIEVGPLPDRVISNICSPGELRVYDSHGRVTGLVNGEIRSEIPLSTCYGDIVVILHPGDSYRYEIVGTTDGLYGLNVALITGLETTTCTAIDIPTSANATHEYTVNWTALSQGEKAVTIEIDSDGDGEVDETVFTTPPDEPSNPSPPDSAGNILVDIVLNWAGGDPDGDNVTYKVYFGSDENPPLVSDNQTETSYSPSLNYGTKYYWRVVARDEHGIATQSPIWQFTTVGATLEGHVTFMGRGSNNTQWIETFVVRGFEQGNLTNELWNGTATTNNTGVFTMTGLTPGTYDIGIKNWTCLSELVTNVTLSAGVTTVVDFGTIRVGDADNNDIITGADRSLLYSGWGSQAPNPGYNAHADFNRDGWLTGADRSFMYTYWGQHGDLS